MELLLDLVVGAALELRHSESVHVIVSVSTSVTVSYQIELEVFSVVLL